MTDDLDSLIGGAVAGLERSLGRLLTMLENDEACAAEIAAKIAAKISGTGSPGRNRAFRVGITGSPGSGKSTLIDRLLGLIRAEDRTVAVVCVDPTSPVTGGAVLGDRVRMEQHYSDEGVFIRSMASRGHWGGIAKSVGGALDLLEACGKDVVIVETVGIGQEGVEITHLVDVTVLVLAPGWGDSMQLMKAGVLEVADVIVVNKADLGAASLVEGIDEILSLGRRDRVQPVIETQAVNNKGIDTLWAELAGRERASSRVCCRVERKGGG